MGNPTFGGIELLQLRMADEGFSLPVFRQRVCSTVTISPGFPLEPRRYFDGESADLLALARNAPYDEPENVSLTSMDGHYGILIEKTFFHGSLMLSSDQGVTSFATESIEMRAFGDPAFCEYFSAHQGELRKIARYGKPRPCIRERFAMRFLSYHFPPPVMEEIPAVA